MTSSVTVFVAAIGKRSVYDKIVMEIWQNEKKDGNKRHLYMNLQWQDGLGVEFAAYEGKIIS